VTTSRIKGRETVGFQSGGGSNTRLFVISPFTVSQKVRVQRNALLSDEDLEPFKAVITHVIYKAET
jgi:hypothetical protein